MQRIQCETCLQWIDIQACFSRFTCSQKCDEEKKIRIFERKKRDSLKAPELPRKKKKKNRDSAFLSQPNNLNVSFKKAGSVKPMSRRRRRLVYAEKIIADQRKEIARLEAKVERSLSAIKRKEAFNFYESEAWQKLRYRVLAVYGRRCMCCGRTDGPMHVDHIKPRSKYPELALDFDNLQVLCEACNLGKSNTDETDWRPHKNPNPKQEISPNLSPLQKTAQVACKPLDRRRPEMRKADS